MIIVRFMDVSLGPVRMQVNKKSCENDHE